MVLTGYNVTWKHTLQASQTNKQLTDIHDHKGTFKFQLGYRYINSIIIALEVPRTESAAVAALIVNLIIVHRFFWVYTHTYTPGNNNYSLFAK